MAILIVIGQITTCSGKRLKLNVPELMAWPFRKHLVEVIRSKSKHHVAYKNLNLTLLCPFLSKKCSQILESTYQIAEK